MLIPMAAVYLLMIQHGFTVGLPPRAGVPRTATLSMGARYGPLIIGGDFWRFATSLFVHQSVLQILLTGLMAALSMPFERQFGFWRTFAVWWGCGLYSAIFACSIVPLQVTCGPNGAYCGLAAAELCDVITTWHRHRNAKKLGRYLALVALAFVFGVFGFCDNWANVGGLLFGALVAMWLLPASNFYRFPFVVRLVGSVFLFPVLALVFVVTVIMFYGKVEMTAVTCPGCYRFNGVLRGMSCMGSACE
jgi:rhomboid protease GluP